MNCPSRNDDVELHPGWNQSPPRFAADLTTCADFNGIANARELGEADGLYSSAQNPRHGELQDSIREENTIPSSSAGKGVGGSSTGPYTHTVHAASSNEHHAGPMERCTKWLLSVLVASVFVSYVSGNTPTFSPFNDSPARHHLARRDACEAGKAQPDYDLPFHVGGLLIILFVSTSGCAFPILVIKFPRLRIPPVFLFGAKHFGTGVLIATAFVHLLPTAFGSLGNPCLPAFWTTKYQAMPGAIMLASIFFVTMIEMVFSPARHVCGGNEAINAISRQTKVQEEEEDPNPPLPPQASPQTMHRTYSNSSIRVREMGSLGGRGTSISRTLSRYRQESAKLDAIAIDTSEAPEAPKERTQSSESAVDDAALGPPNDPPAHILSPEQLRQKAVMQCFLLEMGILFHSIFIGMSLGVAVGSDFIVLLIAIVFHQTFEGLALGVRIAGIKWPAGAYQPWLMALAYGCTTPLGQAIGIATHTLYSPGSEIGLLVVGIMNAVSAGFLVFASLVELMSEDFLSDESWVVLRGRKRVVACLLVFAGAFLMSLVGAWA